MSLPVTTNRIRSRIRGPMCVSVQPHDARTGTRWIAFIAANKLRCGDSFSALPDSAEQRGFVREKGAAGTVSLCLRCSTSCSERKHVTTFAINLLSVHATVGSPLRVTASTHEFERTQPLHAAEHR